MASRRWTREETIVALHTYCRIPFKNSSKSHPLVIEVARKIGRTPSALNMKIGNFGRLDPTLQASGISGLGHGSKMDEEIWDEFYGDFERLAQESENLLKEVAEDDFIHLPPGEYREAMIRQRVNQEFFRAIVLSSYNNACCITGLSCPNVLEACHIADWAIDSANRTNPQNGLCLTRTLHKAYDDFLLAVTPDYRVIVSDRLYEAIQNNSIAQRLINEIDGATITLPDRFQPSKELLDYHYQIFLNQQ